jgi:hypothetical protein
MNLVKNHSFSKLIRIDQEDIEEALRYLIIKKNIVEDIREWNIKFPRLGNSDLIKMENRIL